MIGELAELKFRNAQSRAAGIDFSASGRQTRDLLTAKEISQSLWAARRFFGH